MTDLKTQSRIEEVNALLAEFEREYLADALELAGFNRWLWEIICQDQNFSITRGFKEVWASAVIYVIARLNFCFDRSTPNYLPPDTICGFFGTKKETVSAKAAQIEKVCRIRTGEPGLCSEELSDSFTFVTFSNGMVLTKKMARDLGFIP